MFSLKQYIQNLFYPPDNTGHYLNLTDGQVQHLLSLHSDEHFEVYLKALDALTNLKNEALLASQSEFQQTRLVGEVNGLRSAARLIDEIIAKEKHADAEQRKRNQRKREPSDAARRLATFGSPAWSASNSK